MLLTDHAFILRRKPSGERHHLLVCFTRNNGLLHVMARQPTGTKSHTLLPDMLQCGELHYRQKNSHGPAFLSEFICLQHHPELATRYAAFRCACALAHFLELNLTHLEDFGPAWHLFERSLNAFAHKPCPELALFKACYLFARNEGFPVQQQWLADVPQPERNQIQQALHAPLGDIAVDPATATRWQNRLNQYFAGFTDIRPPADTTITKQT